MEDDNYTVRATDIVQEPKTERRARSTYEPGQIVTGKYLDTH
jgi:hypothetical protein